MAAVLAAFGAAQQERAAAAAVPEPGLLLAPIATLPLPRAVDASATPAAPEWLLDVLAVRDRFVAAHREPPRDLDLTRAQVLAVPAVLAAGERLVWRGAYEHEGCWYVELAMAPAVGAPVAAGAAAAADAGALFVLPRTDRALRLHVLGSDAAPAQVPPPRAHQDPELSPVLAMRVLEHGGGAAVRCERATTPAEWRALRERLGAAGADLRDDYADFASACVVLVAPPSARAFPGFDLAVATEEGVDVVTVRQRFPSGRAVPERDPVVLLTLPRRARQLAVVLADTFGPAGHSTTVGTFEPLR